MKYAVILPDGAADLPCSRLKGRTPLQAARMPNTQSLAKSGVVGRVVTVPSMFNPGSEIATLSLFGYDPRTDFPGRGPLEAAAQGIQAAADDIIFRCNLVTIDNETMADFTAGHISQIEANELIQQMNERLGSLGCRFFSGVSYRNLMILSDAAEIRLKTTPPHDIPGKPLADFLPTGLGQDRIREIMLKAREVLSRHPINTKRQADGLNRATDIWLWGQGRTGRLASFQQRFGFKGAAIAAVDLIRGIARLAGLELLHVPGATGYLDTAYAEKGRVAAAALEQFDIVFVHIEAPDEAGHLGDAQAKVTALERIDEHVVGLVLSALKSAGAWRMLIAPDHPTPVDTRVHSSSPPPFCVGGSDILKGSGGRFDEIAAADGPLIEPGFELMEQFLRGRWP